MTEDKIRQALADLANGQESIYAARVTLEMLLRGTVLQEEHDAQEQALSPGFKPIAPVKEFDPEIKFDPPLWKKDGKPTMVGKKFSQLNREELMSMRSFKSWQLGQKIGEGAMDKAEWCRKDVELCDRLLKAGAK